MNVENFMKKNVFSIHRDQTMQTAGELMIKHHIGSLPVVDEGNRLIGLLRLRNLLSFIMPDFVDLVDNIDFVNTFGAVESRTPKKEDRETKIYRIMEPPISVLTMHSLLRAAAVMRQNEIYDLPVINAEKQLVGLVSHVDIGTALLDKLFQNIK